VIATYQSSPLVDHASGRHHAIDLAIFDEAHKTTSSEETGYSYWIGEHDRPIHKRLFLTATPRGMAEDLDLPSERSGLGMYDVKLYGPHAYVLSFGQAIEEGLITDYRLLIPVIYAQDVPPALRSSLEENHPEDQHRHLATLLAIHTAMQRYGLTKAVTFHSTIQQAATLAAMATEADLQTFLPLAETFHISGEMKSDQRAWILDLFAASAKGILTNARCLQEGVDCPAIDLVAFCSPKRSAIDIIQALGRALRPYAGKRYAYILLPIFLDGPSPLSTDLHGRLARYEGIWEVIRALAAEDDRLNTWLQLSRQRMGVINKVSPKDHAGEVLSTSLIRIDSDIPALWEAISTTIVLTGSSHWDQWYGALTAWRADHGAAAPPRRSPLGKWIVRQRELFRVGRLLPDRIGKLMTLDIRLESVGIAESWSAKFQALQVYMDAQGQHAPPHTHPLHKWCQTQRVRFRRGQLSQDQIRQLDGIGFVWEPLLAKLNASRSQGPPLQHVKPLRRPLAPLTITHPALVREWHPSMNGDLQPHDVSFGSTKRVWWQCQNGHEWPVAVYLRVGAHHGRGSSCPVCSLEKRRREKRVRAHAPLPRHLVGEWHPTLNGTREATHYSAGSGYRAWWRCRDDDSQIYQSPIRSRSRGTGCPICANVRPDLSKKSLAVCFPLLATQWHPTKNGGVTPADISATSGKHVWWRCPGPEVHEWASRVIDRTYERPDQAKCPSCTSWDVRLLDVKEYVKTHTCLPSAHPLYGWLAQQKRRARLNQLAPARAVMLRDIEQAMTGSAD
jgi:hypothetical protein